MIVRPEGSTGVLIVRAWREGEGLVLRARVTAVTDVMLEECQIVVATSIDEVCDAVRVWLESFTAER